MFKKIILVAGVFGTMSAMMAVGCSSSSTSGGGATESDGGGSGSKDGSTKSDGGGGLTGDGGGTGDGGTKKDGGSVVVGDSGVITVIDAGGSDGGPITLSDGGTVTAPACYDLTNAGALADTAPVAHSNKCTSTQISGYATACLGSSATTTTCNTFITANADCSTCIGGTSTASAFPAIIPVDNAGNVVPNVGGCYAALSTGDATCQAAFNQQDECLLVACNTCADNTSYSSCIDYGSADTAGCAGAYPISAACNTAIVNSEGVAANQTACGAGATTFEAGYTAVATTLCGP